MPLQRLIRSEAPILFLFTVELMCYVTNYFPFLRWLVSQSVESSALTAVNNCAARLWIAAASHPQQLILPTRGLNEIA